MTTIKGFNTSAGVLALIQHAVDDSKDDIKFTLNGDLNQMSIQQQFLRNKGFKMGNLNVYPGFYTEEDYKAALKEIWDNKCEGWWMYRELCIKYEICNAETSS